MTMSLAIVSTLSLAAACSSDNHEALSAATGGAPVVQRTVDALKARPLTLPHIASAATCPVTSASSIVSPDIGPVVGDGLARAALDPSGPVEFFFGNALGDTDWAGEKVLWALSPDATGPVLVRGRRLDADGGLGFGQMQDPDDELVLDPADQAPLSGGWRGYPSSTRLEASGCYGYQIDALDGASTIVFTAHVVPK